MPNWSTSTYVGTVRIYFKEKKCVLFQFTHIRGLSMFLCISLIIDRVNIHFYLNKTKLARPKLNKEANCNCQKYKNTLALSIIPFLANYINLFLEFFIFFVVQSWCLYLYIILCLHKERLVLSTHKLLLLNVSTVEPILIVFRHK